MYTTTLLALLVARGAALATPPSRTHSLRADEDKALAEEDKALAEDLGLEFDATAPLRGLTVGWPGLEDIINVLPENQCAPLRAAVDLHTYYFKEAPDSQQLMEREFLANVSAPMGLCANANQTEEEYTEKLHGMLDVVRTAINRHVHSAFWVKSVCTKVNICYNSSKLFKTYEETFTGGEQCAYPDFLDVRDGSAYSITCLGSVLTHEKYNLVEGFYFANMCYFMLEQGSAFCRDPQLPTILEIMSAA